MTPADRIRIQKAAADCGFEMMPFVSAGGVELRSARFPEVVTVRQNADGSFEVACSDPALLEAAGERNASLDDYSLLYSALRSIAARARTKPNRIADEFQQKTALLPRSTEAERLILQRVGQSMFRDALLDYWQGTCCITRLDVSRLLRASHIRPWAECDDDEQRLDVFNGLLLAPHLDALFDQGLMTVQDSGEVLLSREITTERRLTLGLPEEMTVTGLRERHFRYLSYHRGKVWAG